MAESPRLLHRMRRVSDQHLEESIGSPLSKRARSTAGPRFKAVKASVVREGCELDSGKVGVLHAGTEVAVLEERTLPGGVVRVRYSEGWVSRVTADGLTTLAPVDTAEATAFPTGCRAKCTKKSQIRAGFAMDSEKAGVLELGQEVEVLSSRTNENGIVRVQFEGGWVSEKASTGALCLQVSAPAPAKASPPKIPSKKSPPKIPVKKSPPKIPVKKTVPAPAPADIV
eukprot:COSAG06_NODE_10478_length_1676_cov_1.060241_1_plen_226_part_10